MASPSLELTGAVVARLKSFAPLTALIGARVYDGVPDMPTFPYLEIGPTSETQDDVDCVPGCEISLRVEAWSRAPSFVEVRRVGEAVKDALHHHTPELEANALVFLEHRRTDYVRDPDGLTKHATIEFAASVEQP